MQHIPFDDAPGVSGYSGIWKQIELGRVDAEGYRAHVLACVTELRDSGLFYNSEVGPRAAILMRERYGYPDLATDPRADFGLASRDFGSHCYMAGGAYRARKEREANKAAADGLRAGQTFKRLRMPDGAQITSAVLDSFTHTGAVCRLSGKRGAARVQLTCTAVSLLAMVERANKRAATLAARRER